MGDTCVHHWLVPPPNGELLLLSTCKLCGETREFECTLKYDVRKPARLPRKQHDEMRAIEHAAWELTRGGMRGEG